MRLLETIMKNILWIIALWGLLGLGTNVYAVPQDPVQPAASQTPKRELSTKDKDEVEFGKKIVEEVVKQFKMVEDPALNERVNRIGLILADVARNTPTEARYGESGAPPFEYTFKIIDDKDVNAFSVPGGFIFVHKGLLDFVQSDHELAGVLAHEIAHAAHRHVMALVRADDKISREVMLPVLLGALIGRMPAGDTLTLLTGTQLYRIAKLNSFGQEAETDSDLTALEYMRRSPYNSVGLLTFMERLAAEERKRPQIDWGIYRTHPPSKERAQALRKGLQEAGISIRRREVSPALRIVARLEKTDKKEGTPPEEAELYEVAYENISIFRPAHDPDKGDSKSRAEKIAERINILLDDGVEMFEVRLSADGQAVLIKGEEVIRITPTDSELYDQTPEQVALQVREAMRRLLWSDTIRLLY
jgi:Zn-dependent protease with chaperone function